MTTACQGFVWMERWRWWWQVKKVLSNTYRKVLVIDWHNWRRNTTERKVFTSSAFRNELKQRKNHDSLKDLICLLRYISISSLHRAAELNLKSIRRERVREDFSSSLFQLESCSRLEPSFFRIARTAFQQHHPHTSGHDGKRFPSLALKKRWQSDEKLIKLTSLKFEKMI